MSLRPKLGNPAPSNYRLVCIEGTDQDREFLVSGNELTIGRAPDTDAELRDPSVATHHCSLRFEHGAWRVRDVSGQGTFVNNERIAAEHELRSGDILTVGQVKLAFLEDERTRVQTNAEATVVGPPPEATEPRAPARPNGRKADADRTLVTAQPDERTVIGPLPSPPSPKQNPFREIDVTIPTSPRAPAPTGPSSEDPETTPNNFVVSESDVPAVADKETRVVPRNQLAGRPNPPAKGDEPVTDEAPALPEPRLRRRDTVMVSKRRKLLLLVAGATFLVFAPLAGLRALKLRAERLEREESEAVQRAASESLALIRSGKFGEAHLRLSAARRAHPAAAELGVLWGQAAKELETTSRLAEAHEHTKAKRFSDAAGALRSVSSDTLQKEDLTARWKELRAQLDDTVAAGKKALAEGDATKASAAAEAVLAADPEHAEAKHLAVEASGR